jgi:formylmethanofuran dehydrogenase subunit E
VPEEPYLSDVVGALQHDSVHLAEHLAVLRARVQQHTDPASEEALTSTLQRAKAVKAALTELLSSLDVEAPEAVHSHHHHEHASVDGGAHPLPTHPRVPIEAMIRNGALEGLLKKAGELHGHFCPYLALGVRAGYTALRQLGIERTLGMEEVVAIVDANNCFADGVQMVTGCSFANNALIYRDLGKTAVTVVKRDGDAVRVAVKTAYSESFDERYPEPQALFEKIVVNREPATPEEQAELSRLWAETSHKQLALSESEIFTITRETVSLPSYAPIFGSVTCAQCGERVMETKARIWQGEPVCLTCAEAEHAVVDGTGVRVQKGAF